MPTLKELRLQAGFSVAKLARLADVDRQTVVRAEEGIAVQDAKAYAIVRVLSVQLDRNISFKDVNGLKVIGED